MITCIMYLCVIVLEKNRGSYKFVLCELPFELKFSIKSYYGICTLQILFMLREVDI